jgi:predicted RNase H-like HicB family nuclease
MFRMKGGARTEHTEREGGFWAFCPEIPGANGQGETIKERKHNLKLSIELIPDDGKAYRLRGLSPDPMIRPIQKTTTGLYPYTEALYI